MKFNSILTLLVFINQTLAQEIVVRSHTSANWKGRDLASTIFSYGQPETKDLLQLQVI